MPQHCHARVEFRHRSRQPRRAATMSHCPAAAAKLEAMFPRHPGDRRPPKRFLLALGTNDTSTAVRREVEAYLAEHSGATSSLSPDKGGHVQLVLHHKDAPPLLLDRDTQRIFAGASDAAVQELLQELRQHHRVWPRPARSLPPPDPAHVTAAP